MNYRHLKLILCLAGIVFPVVVVVYITQSKLSPDDHKYRDVVHSDLHYIHRNSHSEALQMNDLSPHWSFIPSFPVPASSGSSRQIPRILHQVWDFDKVPQRYDNWIRTWKIVNPKWEYWFWTMEDVRQLISQHYKEHLVLYDNYESAIFRADVMRYFVLHRYGGVYADLDMDALRPLDNWTVNYNCVLSEESYEHTFIVHEKLNTNVVNGFFMCRPGHSLMKRAIESLPKAAFRHFGDYLRAAGPIFFNEVYERHRRSNAKEELESVTVVPPKYFLPTYDKSESDTISGKCSPARRKRLPEKGQLLCRELMIRGFRNEPDVSSYTNHHWVHAYMYDESWKTTDTLEILKLVPSVVFGSRVLNSSYLQ